MGDSSLYSRFWPSLDSRLANGTGAPRSYRPGTNYRDFSGPRLAGVPTRWSVNFPAQDGQRLRVEANVSTARDDVSAWLRQHLVKIQNVYARDEQLVVEDRPTTRGGHVVRLAAYRDGAISQEDLWPEFTEWFSDRLGALQAAVRAVAPDAEAALPRPRRGGLSNTPPGASFLYGSRGYQRPYVPAPDREQILQSAIDTAMFALGHEDLHPSVRKRLLIAVTWAVTEVDGKLTTRYRSVSAMQYDGPNPYGFLRHDHVFTRKRLLQQLIESPGSVESLLRQAVGCLVTKEEQDALSAYDGALDGWERYAAAKVDVCDAMLGELVVSEGKVCDFLLDVDQPSNTTVRSGQSSPESTL